MGHVSTNSNPGLLRKRITPQHTALLVVDMLNDFCSPAGMADRAGRDLAPSQAIIPTIGQLLLAARAAGVTIVYIQHTVLSDGASNSSVWLDARSRARASSADLCMEGTWGHQFVEGLQPEPGDLVIPKHRYSGFAGTSLDILLRSHRVDSLVLTGVSTNSCVESTLRAGFDLEYFITVVEDGVASWSQSLHLAALENVRARFGLVVPATAVLETWWEALEPTVSPPTLHVVGR